MVFLNIITQLAKDNEKFVYGCVKEGASAIEFEEAIEWLVSAGMVLRIYNQERSHRRSFVYFTTSNFRLKPT